MRKIISLITALACSLMLSVTAFADNNGCYTVNTGENDAMLFDIADALTPDEEEFAKNMLTLTSINSQTNVGVFIIDETADDDPLSQAMEYADILFKEYFGADNHGILLLINTNTYYNWISLNGELFGYGDPAYIDQYLENMSEDLINGNYADAIKVFCESIADTATEFYANHTGTQAPEEIVPETTEPETTDSLAAKYDLSRCKIDLGFYSIATDGNIALLHDADDSLDPEDEDFLIRRVIQASEATDLSVAIIITDDIGTDKSDYGVMDFADVYYENHCGMNTDGILLLLNNDTEYDWISTSGRAIDTFDRSIDYIFDNITDDIKKGNYGGAVSDFCNSVIYYNENVPAADYSDYDDDHSISLNFSLEAVITTVFTMFVFIAIGLLIFSAIIQSGYKLKKNPSVADYVLKDSLKFTQQSDTYLRTYTTRTRVNSSSSGGHRSGGSRSHRSSGGGRHGGGGRRR